MTDPSEFKQLCYWCSKAMTIMPGKLPFCNADHQSKWSKHLDPDGQGLERMMKDAEKLADKAKGTPAAKTLPFVSRSGGSVLHDR